MEELKDEIDSNEVMDILHISKPTFFLWMKNGKLIPYRRAGRKWYFKREYIENFGKVEHGDN